MDLAGLFKVVKPEPRHRTRSFNQRDIARPLRAAKAAGVEARVVIEEGRITLVPTKMVPAATDTGENPWERFRRGWLSEIRLPRQGSVRKSAGIFGFQARIFACMESPDRPFG